MEKTLNIAEKIREVIKVFGEKGLHREISKVSTGFCTASYEASKRYPMFPTFRNGELTLIDLIGINNYLYDYLPKAIKGYNNYMVNWFESSGWGHLLLQSKLPVVK